MSIFVRKYTRKNDDDGLIYTAIQYGNEDLTWDGECMPRVAQFVLGLDVETRVHIGNEHIMDVVQPIPERWQPEFMVADIRVADWVRGTTYNVRLGDFLVKSPEGELMHVGLGDFRIEYVRHHETVLPPTPEEELAKVIYAHFPWEGDVYERAATAVAKSVIDAGWIKP